VLAATLTTQPEARQSSYLDYFGNHVHCFDVADAHDELITRARVEVETLLSNPFDYAPIAPERERAWIAEALRAQPRLWDFVLHRSELTPAAQDWSEAAEKVPPAPGDRPLVQSVIAARDWIAETLSFKPESDTRAAPSELLAAGEGSAADLAHLLITIVRGWGVPARYVSGYQERTDEGDEDEPIDPSPHAWAEILIPGAGWRGVDATAGLLTGDTYITGAVGRDASDTVAQRCTFKGEGEREPPRIAVRLQRQQ
jgi:transglutaminase-like putative cysteine protease